jgi:hypothetical protein
MTEKKARAMSLKGFLHKSTGKAALAASGFIAAHREFLLTGELALFTAPILSKVDSRELLPTPALEEIKAVVLAHHLAEEIRTQEEKMARANEPSERKTKAYVATIYDAKTGEVVQITNDKGKVVDLTESFEDGTRAEGWTDRRLFDGAPHWFGVVTATKLFKQDGSNFTANIQRDDSIARILRKPKAPVMKAQKKSGGRLSFGVKCHESRASFSRG